MIPVCAYCRVSTDKDDQINSLMAQQRYFRSYIEQNPEWTLLNIYADEGLSGTTTAKRKEFQKMMEDARAGRFRLLLTKEVSRFARNILDTILYTRELRTLGVTVIFLNDGIRTNEADSELRLSILGSIAQEESRRTSQRVKWGQTRRMEQGVVFGHSLIGYQLKKGTLSIEPEGARLVQNIFYQYAVAKQGSSQISRELKKQGKIMSTTQILRILKNEKYVGDLVQKKSYTPDYLTHKKQKNHGEEQLIIQRDHHPAIISRVIWEEAQKEISRRGRQKGKHNSSVQYPLSGKIFCGNCGRAYVSRTRRLADGSATRRWQCNNANCTGMKSLRDCVIQNAVYEAVNAVIRASGTSIIYDPCTALKNGQEDGLKTSKLQQDVAEQIIKGEIRCNAFLKNILSSLIVYSDHIEIWLTELSQPVLCDIIG